MLHWRILIPAMAATLAISLIALTATSAAMTNAQPLAAGGGDGEMVRLIRPKYLNSLQDNLDFLRKLKMSYQMSSQRYGKRVPLMKPTSSRLHPLDLEGVSSRQRDDVGAQTPTDLQQSFANLFDSFDTGY